MKFTTILLPTMLASTALAAGPPVINDDKFSLEAMTKWQKSISENPQLKAEYEKSLDLLKNSADAQLVKDCSDTLKPEDIQLFSAKASSRKRVKKQWEEQLVKDISQLNDIIFTYVVKGGKCGLISVGTELKEKKKGLLKSTVYEYEWRDPIPEFRVETLRTLRPLDSASRPLIDLGEVKYGIKEALAKGIMEDESLRSGVQNVVFMNFRPKDNSFLAYRFQGMKKDNEDSPRSVYISAVDGRFI